MCEPLSFEALRDAVRTGAAFRARTRLEADSGDGGKVFPPTYAGGVYAVEDRRIDGRVVRCVLLDSVQSQANRMEEVLQDAFLPNWRELPTDGIDPTCDLPVVAVHVQDHGWVTSLTAPHRIHDAILRDSNLDGTRFRESAIGQAVRAARLWDATAFFRYCPTALLFGTWDSTAGEGLDSAKIPRAVVSEIIGVDITPGVRTGSRIDPLGIGRESATIYRRADNGNDWTLNEDEAARNERGTAIRFGRGEKGGKPAAINHGNIPPDLARFGDRREIRTQHLDVLPDILRDEPAKIEAHIVKPGGVTMAYAQHTWVLSLTQLRRLRFPIGRDHDDHRNHATRTVLAALALYALALQLERGYWLRSRCELIPENELTIDLIGGANASFTLGSPEQVREALLDTAIQGAQHHLAWEGRVIRLTPTPQLVELVRGSDARRPAEETEPEEVADAGAES
jgi:CRISPR-associated protein Csb1